MKKKYITLVFEYENEDDVNSIRAIAKAENCRGFSMDHEMRRLHWYERAAEEIEDFCDLKDVLDKIAGHPEIASVKTMDELRI